MQFEKRRLGLLREAFRSEREGSSGCKRGVVKGRVKLKNKVNTVGVKLNKNERSADSYVSVLS